MTRMLVPRLHEKHGDLRGVTGATMQDGTVYQANRAGHLDVERADHVRAMQRDPEIAGDIVAETFHAIDRRPGVFCSCGPTELWPWTKACPRCGADLTQEGQT